jgi:hypothetical protein
MSPQFLVVETVDLLLDEDPNTDIEMNDHSDGEESDEQLEILAIGCSFEPHGLLNASKLRAIDHQNTGLLCSNC